MKDIYPLTIIQDRYTGTYSHGLYTAWNLDFYSIPQEIDGDNNTCGDFWDKFQSGELVLYNVFNKKVFVGLGNTPDEAFQNLIKQCTNNLS